jgi:hypothetical protein
MTPDPNPLTAVLGQLAACREQLSELGTREAAHHAELDGQVGQLAGAVSALNLALAGNTAALARLDTLDRQVTELARQLPGPDGGDGGGYQPRPAPSWWKLGADERRVPLAELRDWVDHVYRPGYGHLAAALGPCWPEHALCLYGLDIASQLWCALYLQPERSTGLLSAQAEYQIRVLPAIAAQLREETTGCGHNPPASSLWSTR